MLFYIPDKLYEYTSFTCIWTCIKTYQLGPGCPSCNNFVTNITKMCEVSSLILLGACKPEATMPTFCKKKAISDLSLCSSTPWIS